MSLRIKLTRLTMNSDVAHIGYGAIFASLRKAVAINIFDQFGVIIYRNHEPDELQKKIQKYARPALTEAVRKAYEEEMLVKEKTND